MAATFPPPVGPGGPSGPRHRRSAPFVKRRQPGKLPAALLALLVHGGFFVVLVLGVSWQIKQPIPTTAELWTSLPDARNVPTPVETEPPPPPPPPEVKKVEAKPVEQPTKADIELKNKKERAEKERIKREEDLAEARRKAAEAEKQRKLEEARRRTQEAQMKADQDAREATQQASRQAAINAYVQKLSRLINERANIPESVAGRVEFSLTLRLLVNGAVFDARVTKPSGNRVYDEAVQRAISGIQTWPLPDPPDILGGRREMTINIIYEK